MQSKNKRHQIYQARPQKNSAPRFAEEIRGVCEYMFHVGGRQQVVLEMKIEYLKIRAKLTPEKAKCPLIGSGKIKTRYNQHERYPLGSIPFPPPFLIVTYF